jgi:uncharacterized membrane protein YbhN (UPF0104 family)
VIILDAVLMTLIAAGIVSVLVWSICTQYRHAGCEHLRIRRRLRVSVRFVTVDDAQMVPSTGIAL